MCCTPECNGKRVTPDQRIGLGAQPVDGRPDAFTASHQLRMSFSSSTEVGMAQAKVFESGIPRAVRPLRSMRLELGQVSIVRHGDALIIRSATMLGLPSTS